MTIDFSLHQSLQKWNERLRLQQRKAPEKAALRRELAERVGHFVALRKWTEEQLADFSRGRPLLGVDGSVFSWGGNYPFTITAFQAVAKATFPVKGKKDKVVLSALYSPLESSSRAELQRFIEELGEGWTEETVFPRFRGWQMARLELTAALQAVRQFHPFLVLLDGPFSRFQEDRDLSEQWEAFRQVVAEEDALVVGVVEEIGTMKLQRFLSDHLRDQLLTGHDREVLFGSLEPGEALLPKNEIEIKRDAYVVFARLADHPQAIACNFLPEQRERVAELMPLLYTLTPKRGRGIPFWLDLVDVETRITRREWDLFVRSSIDSDLLERFLRPQRERRDY